MGAHRFTTAAFTTLFVLSLLGWLTGSQAIAAPSTTTFSGQATAVKGSVLSLPINSVLPCSPPSSYFCIVDTGPLTATETVQGGSHDASLACYPSGNGCVIQSPVGDPTEGAVRARVLHAAVVAGGNRSRAEASVANLGLNVAGVKLSADFLTADATAKCANGNASVSGNSEVARVNNDPVLVIAGQTIVVSETPNYDVVGNTPGLAALLPPRTQIIINKQSTGPNGSGGQQIDVTALYINVPGLAELFIADVHADISCAVLSQCPGKHAFVTSGGFIDLTGSNKQHFAAAGRNMTTWGHVLYRDTASGYSLHVKNPFGVVYNSLAQLQADATAAGFNSGAVNALDSSKFQGGAILTWTDQGGGKVLLVDEGEPGRSDYFAIIAPSASTGGTLAGGNIQMHGKC
jgi:hypothetical protein